MHRSLARWSRALALFALISLLVPIASLAGPSRSVSAQDTITVYELGITPDYPNWPELLALFAQKEPNIKIETAPTVGGSNATLARLKAEGANTEISLVLFGQASGPALRDADLLAPIQPTDADLLRTTDRDAAGSFYSWATWTPAFIYNQDNMPNPPKSYAELLTASGRLSYDDPSTSASGVIFLVGAILANGGTIENPEPGFEYLKQLKPRIATYSPSGGVTLSLIPKGEVDFGVHYSEANMYNKYIANQPVGIVVPKEGMPLSALSVAVSKYAPQPEAAKKFVDFLLSKEAQELLAKGYFRPVRPDVEIPADVRARYPENYDADYAFDWETTLPYQAAWIQRWNNEIK